MKTTDTEGLLLVENYDEIEEGAFKLGGKYIGKDWYRYTIRSPLPPKPVKQYTKDEIKALEDKMKREGRL